MTPDVAPTSEAPSKQTSVANDLLMFNADCDIDAKSGVLTPSQADGEWTPETGMCPG